MLLGVGKEKKPQCVMLADGHGVNVPMANLKLEATECSVGEKRAVAHHFIIFLS